MTESLGYRKVCARWVLRLLTEDHKGQRKAMTSELLQRYQHEGDEFLLRIVIGDESWFHHFEPETKRQSMEWSHLLSPSKKKAKTVPSAAKVMGSLLGCRGVDFGRIPGTWANHHCCSLCPDTAQAPSCIAR